MKSEKRKERKIYSCPIIADLKKKTGIGEVTQQLIADNAVLCRSEKPKCGNILRVKNDHK